MVAWLVGIFIASAYLGYFFLIYALMVVYLLLIRHDFIARRLILIGVITVVIAGLLLIPFYAFRFQSGVIFEGHPFSEIQFLSARLPQSIGFMRGIIQNATRIIS
jgi:hypothetical protein